uniref:Uncharacterized protein n=1 Tax=Cacopsylla melanoneura TaxID=428564 RepID=A0A8D9BB27_9HEMI
MCGEAHSIFSLYLPPPLSLTLSPFLSFSLFLSPFAFYSIYPFCFLLPSCLFLCLYFSVLHSSNCFSSPFLCPSLFVQLFFSFLPCQALLLSWHPLLLFPLSFHSLI